MERIQIHWITSGENTKGWMHTHGMDQHGLPELEVRGVPGFLAESAASLLRNACDYMLTSGREVHLGEVMATSERTRFRFVKSQPIPGEEEHYAVERWQIVEVDVPCEEYGCTPAELN